MTSISRPIPHARMSIQRCLSLFMLFIVVTDIAVTAAGTTRSRRKNGNPQSRSIRVMNKSGVRIDIFWIHPNTRDLAPSHTEGDGVMFGGETGISSYIGHEFEVQELPSKKTQKCLQEECRKAYFIVNTKEDQWITIANDFSVSLEDSVSRATQKAKVALSGCLNITDIIELSECFTREAKSAIDKEKADIAFQATIRKSMGEQLSDYSCGSSTVSSASSSFISPILLRPVKVTTTPSIRNDTYNNQLVQTLFESDYTSVTLYENALSENECEEIFSNNASYTVSSTIKNKVQQILQHAGIDVPETESSPLISANYAFKIESGPITAAPVESDDECELQPDGSCTKTNDSTTESRTSVVERTSTDDTVYARLIFTCVKADTGKNTTALQKEVNTTNTTLTTSDDDDNSLSYTPSGMMYFTKAGVRIVPTDRSAVIIKYDEVAADTFTIYREVDPFLDQHITCPVTQANMTVATIMFNINH